MRIQRTRTVLVLALVVVAGIGGAYAVTSASNGPNQAGTAPTNDHATDGNGTAGEFETFSSETEFRQYLHEAYDARSGYHGGIVMDIVFDSATERGGPEAATVTATEQATASDSTEAGGPSRYSETNKQVQSIDEPDILKTDGRTIYYSGERRSRYKSEHGRAEGRTRVLDAYPPEETAITAQVNRSGQLILNGDTLVVLSADSVSGYDVSTPDSPTLEWEQDLDSEVVTARLRDDTLYLVLGAPLNASDPCPIRPLGDAVVECSDVYHPTEPVPVDVTYTAMTLDPASGDIRDSVSYVGSRRDTAVYMSENALYATYVESTSRADLYMDFLLTDAKPLLDDDVIRRLERLQTYELSDRAKRVEVESILRQWLAMKTPDERKRIENELQNEFTDYAAANKREFSTTNIVKIGVDEGLSVDTVGEVPGEPLNQFSLDEHDGNLRIATTVGGVRTQWGSTEPENDVYVLDSDMNVTGSVTGMGKDERIYSVRFVGDTGYVVTFKRIDPFHVLDLSDPQNPTLEGELKLPGYSSYLHPLGDDRVLGIGEEDGQVKAVVFDVSDPTDPVVEDDYVLDERWSAIARTHHAFLLDSKHEVFFLPGRTGGYVFSYDDGLSLEKVVSTDRAKRALYIDDYLYVFSESEVVIVDENSWERVKTIELGE